MGPWNRNLKFKAWVKAWVKDEVKGAFRKALEREMVKAWVKKMSIESPPPQEPTFLSRLCKCPFMAQNCITLHVSGKYLGNNLTNVLCRKVERNVRSAEIWMQTGKRVF